MSARLLAICLWHRMMTCLQAYRAERLLRRARGAMIAAYDAQDSRDLHTAMAERALQNLKRARP